MNAWLLPGFSCRDLVAILIKYIEDAAERRLVVCCTYLPYDSEDPPAPREIEELVRYCENENLRLIVVFDSNAQHTAWGSTNCNGRGESLLEFLNSSNSIGAMSQPFAMLLGKRSLILPWGLTNF